MSDTDFKSNYFVCFAARYEEAIQDMETVLRLDPDFKSAHECLAQSRDDWKQVQEKGS